MQAMLICPLAYELLLWKINKLYNETFIRPLHPPPEITYEVKQHLFGDFVMRINKIHIYILTHTSTHKHTPALWCVAHLPHTALQRSCRQGDWPQWTACQHQECSAFLSREKHSAFRSAQNISAEHQLLWTASFFLFVCENAIKLYIQQCKQC